MLSRRSCPRLALLYVCPYWSQTNDLLWCSGRNWLVGHTALYFEHLRCPVCALPTACIYLKQVFIMQYSAFAECEIMSYGIMKYFAYGKM